MKKLYFTFLLLVISISNGFSQLTFTVTPSMTDLTNYFQGVGLTITNMTVTGAPSSFGFYSGSCNCSTEALGTDAQNCGRHSVSKRPHEPGASRAGVWSFSFRSQLLTIQWAEGFCGGFWATSSARGAGSKRRNPSHTAGHGGHRGWDLKVLGSCP